MTLATPQSTKSLHCYAALRISSTLVVNIELVFAVHADTAKSFRKMFVFHKFSQKSPKFPYFIDNFIMDVGTKTGLSY